MIQTKKRKSLQLLFLAAVSVAMIFSGCNSGSSRAEDEITSLQNEVSSLKNDVNSLKNNVSTLESKNSALESQLKSVENNISTLGYKVRP